ncbi:type VII secretion-associated serine protease mycosin [Labedaea rhizosphaerae]|uniref:Membrane-anchored mycosin MYCP n=1 Tax=Labedaea rhizosphaerae TaxID=598644 RepID=A0A4R6SP92_LABRH|nr:type VII secretion-associated serine protease mycosin [Labedaea rhizosphaerae]TDQ05771.1 membrane-anchored mycosin MYCP [Labedaea rhizosphaerae]
MAARPTFRIGAIGTCVLLALTVPAVTTAAAEPGETTTTATTQADPNRAGAKPPPVEMKYLPKDRGQPDETYTLGSTSCVGSLDDGNIVLHDKAWGQQWLRVEEAQKFTRGKGVTVAVIDTGVHPHPYLGDRLIGGGDYVVQKDNGLEDCDGHGTEVAGLIAGDPHDQRIGFIGVAPEARIISIRQSSGLYKGPDKNSGQSGNDTRKAGTLDTLAQAVRRATDRHVGVINMSVDSCRQANRGVISDNERELQAALHYAVEHDVVVVASAGNLNEAACPDQNNGPDPSKPDTIVLPPWFADDVISVAAMDENGDPATFSVHGPWVTLAAPGTKITSLNPTGTGLANQTSFDKAKRQDIDGTSFAAPYVAGVAALVRARYPKLKARQVMNRLIHTAQHPAAPGGRDDVVGYGMVDPVAALTTYIPEEDGIAPAKARDPGPQLPLAQRRDWAPMQVALAGTGGGIGLLLITLFAVHTVRRNRRPVATAR